MNRKRIILIVAIVAVLGVGAAVLIINNNWGEYESNVVRSELDDTVTYSNNEENYPPSLDEIEGIYSVEKLDGNADILFHTEGLKSTKGGFDDFTISFNVLDDFRQSSLEVVIETESLNTGNSTRDEHLMEADFFDAKKYPQIIFKSSSVELGDTSYIAKGELTLNGTTKKLDVPFQHLGAGGSDGVPFETFEGAFQIDRTEFGQEESSGVGNIVEISFYCELKAEA